MIYCYPRFSNLDCYVVRIGGPGLGNLLLPFARSVAYASRNHCKVIAPTWLQLKIGPILRGETDIRAYGGSFDTLSEWLHGRERLFVLLRSERVAEEAAASARDGAIIEFRGLRNYFADIALDHGLVSDTIRRMTKPETRGVAPNDYRPFIGVHVRLGDFASPAPGEPLNFGENRRLPIDWYVRMVQAVRARMPVPLPVKLYSDGDNAELAPLLSLEDCTRANGHSAIADLLKLSEAEVLIGSPSTFSMWASYLGRMPSIWYPGSLREPLLADPRTECEALGAGDLEHLDLESGGRNRHRTVSN